MSEPRLRLRGQHLWMSHELVAEHFPDAYAVLVNFNKGSGVLWIGPMTEDHMMNKFSTVSQYLLKLRNAKGDRTIAIHDLLLDNELPPDNRPLTYKWDSKFNILKIPFLA
ncbi:MAG: hypothetical protein AAGI38_12625 [Bacteroidota bacterium]